MLLFMLTTAAKQGQDIPPVLPLFLGFLLALVLLNLGLSFFRKKGEDQRKNSSDAQEKR
ncbi:hypothetical protein [Anaerotignum propionicum]|nr:hypothetical protein [Anaerotignum propionicum]MEA5056550.1 hypothetical protein [Anaerotignum propionicum]